MKNGKVPCPPKGPWSGNNLQGPVFRNFAIPKVAVRTDVANVVMNKAGFRSRVILSFSTHNIPSIWI